jgi:serine phosphatase RsbU (regulator of sigma subunit)
MEALIAGAASLAPGLPVVAQAPAAGLASAGIQQAIFTSVPLVFAFLSLLLYAFEPRSWRHLLLAVIAVSFAGLAWMDFQELVDPSGMGGPWTDTLRWILVPVMTASVTLFVYSLFLDRIPLQWWVLAVAAALIVLLGVPRPDLAQQLGRFWVLLAIADALRVGAVRWRQCQGNVVVLAVGMGVFGVAGALQMLMDLEAVAPMAGLRFPYLYGGLAMLVGMSIHLAQSLAGTRRDLEQQLVKVRELSAERLDRERAAHEQEVRRRLVEADHARKSAELEEARALQLAMLPAALPELPGWEVAAFMRPATEVGGDYYDFRVEEDGALAVAVGDAVGHGARSGTIVAAAKSLFASHAEPVPVGETLSLFDRVFRGMGLRRAHMAMILARFAGEHCELAAAGMPPVLVRRAGGQVEEIDLPGTPLGALGGAYPTRRLTIEPGDAALFLSDGLPELRAGADQPLGYPRVRELLAAADGTSAQGVVEALAASLEELLAGEQPDDDITFVVVRRVG